MKVYICRPELTIESNENAQKFYQSATDRLKEYVEITEIVTEARLGEIALELDRNTIIIFFNTKKEKEYSAKVKVFLEKAVGCKAKIWGVAMEKDMRIPNKIVGKYQTFDVSVRLENRNLDYCNIETVAQIFARHIVSECCPTCYTENRLLFVSHKRLDGEDIAARLCDKICLLEREKHVFRDVVEVQVGEDAQQIIEERLTESDVFIFLHTPQAAGSEWIKKELQIATLYEIPILWIRIDEAEIENLPVIPAERPHMEYRSEDFFEDKKLEQIVNLVEELSFSMVMNCSNEIYDYIGTFGQWAKNSGIEFSNVDKTRQVYKAVYKEQNTNVYARRQYVQYIQYYGRKIKADDIEAFKKYTDELRYEDGYPQFDSRVMVSKWRENNIFSENLYINNYEVHDIWWKRMCGESVQCRRKKIVISGAFPSTEDELHNQPLMEAVKIFSQEIIRNGYTLVFGAHPTFQKLIFTVAEQCSENPKQAVQVYASDYYDISLDKIEEHATVYRVSKRDDRNSSLTEMREKMIGAEDVCAVICIGGKIKKDNPAEQGVDEEIEIARKFGIPVFLVGTAGGRSGEKALETLWEGSWKNLNEAPEELNKELIYSLDYRVLANAIMAVCEHSDVEDESEMGDC